MCWLSIQLTLPIVTNFALAFNLKTGCWIILGHMVTRTAGFILFCTVAMLECLILPASMVPHLLITGPQPKLVGQGFYFLYFTYEFFLISEIFLLCFCLHLALGLVHAGKDYALQHFEYYLLCHIATWIVNLVCLLLLSIGHKVLLGWYLMFTIILILEMYFVVVVYSYYVCLLMEDEEKRVREKSCFAASPSELHLSHSHNQCYGNV